MGGTLSWYQKILDHLLSLVGFAFKKFEYIGGIFIG